MAVVGISTATVKLPFRTALVFTINQSIFKERLVEVLTDSLVELDIPELVPEVSSMILNDPPELLEYDDRYTRLLFHKIEVKGEELHITFKDGTYVARPF